jgi:hypothetical protein
MKKTLLLGLALGFALSTLITAEAFAQADGAALLEALFVILLQDQNRSRRLQSNGKQRYPA